MANLFNDDFVKAFDFMGINDLDDNDDRKNINNRQFRDIFKPRNSDKRSLSLPDTANTFNKAVFPYSYASESQNTTSSTHNRTFSYPFVNTVKPKQTDARSILNNPSLDNPLNTTNVFIQGLSPLTTPEDLQRAVEQYGMTSSARVIMQPNKKTCKGYGFVQFINTYEAQRAIIALNCKGINAAFAKQESFTARLRRLEDEGSTNLYLSNLPLDMDDGKLSVLFYPANIQSLRVLKNENGESRGVGFVRVKDRQTASYFIDKLHGITLSGSSLPLQVRFADSQSQKDFKKLATRNKPSLKTSTSLSDMSASLENGAVESAFNIGSLDQFQLQIPPLKHSHSYESFTRIPPPLHTSASLEELFTTGNAKVKRKHSFDPFSDELFDFKSFGLYQGNNSQPSISNSNSSAKQATDATKAFVKLEQGLKPQSLQFNTVTLIEPPKQQVLAWLGYEDNAPLITRQAEVILLDGQTQTAWESVVDLPSNISEGKSVKEAHVTKWKCLDKDQQPSLLVEELNQAEKWAKSNPKILEAVKEVGVDPEMLFCDGWCVSIDERFPGRRLQQCLMFARSRPGDSLYAHPLDFVPVFDSHTGELLALDFPPLNAQDGEPAPPSSAKDNAERPRKFRFPPPSTNQNYLPEQIKQDDPSFKLREGLKPIHITQPEGVSYNIEGRVLRWQNWSLHVGFNYRDGLVLNNVTYDDNGTIRPLFYRLSIAEMVVPYGITKFPGHRKHAFDTGEYGIGTLSNSLSLGCDCLGSISYMDADFVKRSGESKTTKSAVCIHEEDAGILHKHTDFRDLKVHVARNRKLIISNICTVANYEYGFYWSFGLDGNIELEVKLTGIVNVTAMGPNEPRNKQIETEVAPRIAAPFHQHLFSLRIDSMIDGQKNQVVQTDIVPDEDVVGGPTNYYGNGFHTEKTIFKNSKDAISDYDATKARTWTIENPNKEHYSSGNQVGYKIMCNNMSTMFAKKGSMLYNRAPFARHGIHVTKYQDNTLYPSGMYVNQCEGGEQFALSDWIAKGDNVQNEDIVTWLTFGANHVVRPEDWPIMPVESVKVHLKPSNFFDRNPALDVPSVKDSKSRLAEEAEATQDCCNNK
ncbi:peroxisomal copper amine oxidase [Wallemia mellicola]|uniref:Amine oxidase n=1 Tax=Wallemia mellicola TaxID=1708541 RepID=A0A4T0TKM3_9BASI|nr:peroxisomal copper amine oxidase [Wallemia mellicola]